MQAVTGHSSPTLAWHRLLASMVAFLMALQGCGWQTKVVLSSPSKQNEIHVTRGGSLSSRIEVYLVTRGESRRVFRSTNEGFFQFVDAYWSPDEHVVGLVINGTALFTLAFAVPSGKEVPFESVRKQVEATIVRDYRVPTGERDPIDWTYSNEAVDQFAEESSSRSPR